MWTTALILLFFMNDEGPSLCVVKGLGFSWCPGCGLGHSIHEALHLNFEAAIAHHWLGIPATIVLIYQTIKTIYQTKNKKHGPTNYTQLIS